MFIYRHSAAYENDIRKREHSNRVESPDMLKVVRLLGGHDFFIGAYSHPFHDSNLLLTPEVKAAHTKKNLTCMLRREKLANEQLLSDKHVLAAVNLLKREFPEISGNQSTLLSQTKYFRQKGEGSIQINHDNNRKYWVTSTMQNNEVIVYDSKSIRGISEDIKEQIKQIYGVLCKVAVPRITQQSGLKDWVVCNHICLQGT